MYRKIKNDPRMSAVKAGNLAGMVSVTGALGVIVGLGVRRWLPTLGPDEQVAVTGAVVTVVCAVGSAAWKFVADMKKVRWG